MNRFARPQSNSFRDGLDAAIRDESRGEFQCLATARHRLGQRIAELFARKRVIGDGDDKKRRISCPSPCYHGSYYASNFCCPAPISVIGVPEVGGAGKSEVRLGHHASRNPETD